MSVSTSMTDMPPSLSPQLSIQVNDDPQSRAALRKAGAEYLEAALANAAKGLDPFADKNTRPQPIDEDPDVRAFGRVLRKLKVPAFSVAYVVCRACNPVFVKGSLYSLQAPAVLLFLHMLAVVLTLWIAARYDIFKLNQLTIQGLKGSAVSASLWALQTLCIFSTLHHNSVLFALTWSLVGREVVQLSVKAWASGQPPSRNVRTALLVGGIAAVLEFILDTDKVWVGILMMTLWTGLVVLEAGWQLLKTDSSMGGRITDYRRLGLIRDLADEEENLTPANMAMLKHAVPAVPILLLGFLALEGRELVHHELSVPATELMLLACATHVGAVCSELLLQGSVGADTQLLMKGLATLGSILLVFLEEVVSISWLAVLMAVIACTVAHIAAAGASRPPPGHQA